MQQQPSSGDEISHGGYHMKHNVMLTIASLLSIVLMTFHFTDDVLREGGGPTHRLSTALDGLQAGRRAAFRSIQPGRRDMLAGRDGNKATPSDPAVRHTH